jgi:hypothetical protein
MKRHEWKKDHWYWVRYKFAPRTLTVARPCTIREGNVVDWWLAGGGYSPPVKHNELEIISEIPFPDVVIGCA